MRTVCGRDAASLLADPEIQVVTIAVPPGAQPALIEAAAGAGKHLFCEKPLAADLPSARRAAEAVRRAKVRLAVDFIFPEIPAWKKAKQVLESGVLGGLRHAAITWCVETYAYRNGTRNWKTTGQGGTLSNFVSHTLYYVEWLLGGISRLSARLRPAPTEQRGEARVDAWLEMESGLPLTLSVAADSFLGTGHRVEVYGELGTLVLSNTTADYVNGFELWTGTRQEAELQCQGGRTDSPADGRITAAAAIAGRLIDSIATGAEMIPGVQQGLRVQFLMQAMRAADASGQWQTIPTGASHVIAT